MTTGRNEVSPPPLGRLALGLIAIWFLAILVGGLVLASQPVTGISRLAPGRAVFQALSAATLTGFRASWSDVAYLSAFEQAVLVVLMSSGILAAWGVPVLALLRLAQPAADFTWRRLLGAVLGIPLAVIVMGLLAGVIGRLGGAGGEQPGLPPLWIDTVAAFGNCGLTWHEFSARSPGFWLAMTPLALLGAAGPALVVMGLWGGKLIQTHTRVMLTATAVTFLLAVVLCLVTAIGISPGSADSQRLTAAAALATDSRSSAFTESLASLPRQTQMLAIPLMLLGSAGGTGGGLRVTTAAVLLLGIWRLVRGGSVGRTFGLAGAWFLTLLALFLAICLAMLATTPELPTDRVAILAAGACGNVGLSVDPVSAMGADAYILAAAMLLGRVLSWGVLWWSVTRGDEPVALG